MLNDKSSFQAQGAMAESEVLAEVQKMIEKQNRKFWVVTIISFLLSCAMSIIL